MTSKKRPKKKCLDAVRCSASEPNDVYIVLPSNIYISRIILNYKEIKSMKYQSLLSLIQLQVVLTF